MSNVKNASASLRRSRAALEMKRNRAAQLILDLGVQIPILETLIQKGQSDHPDDIHHIVNCVRALRERRESTRPCTFALECISMGEDELDACLADIEAEWALQRRGALRGPSPSPSGENDE